jgi:thioesterase domain-containing protein
MRWKIGEGYSFLHLHRLTHPQAPVYLTGYSRGGAGVVAVATMLANDNVKIAGLALFDAVDRTLGATADEIQTNVERAIYARRDLNAFTAAHSETAPLAGTRRLALI